jgi:hypothetical protein
MEIALGGRSLAIMLLATMTGSGHAMKKRSAHG